MAVDPTRFSRVSVGWRSSDQSLADYDAADTGTAFSVIQGASIDSLSATAGLTVGSGTVIGKALSSEVSVSLPTIEGHDSETTDATVTGAAVGDAVFVNPTQSNWSGAYLDVTLTGYVTAANTVTLVATNSAVTDITTPDDSSFRITVLNFS